MTQANWMRDKIRGSILRIVFSSSAGGSLHLRLHLLECMVGILVFRCCLLMVSRAIFHDKSRTALPSDQCPQPLDKDTDPKAGLREGPEMHHCPASPHHRTTEVDLTALQDRKSLAD